MTAAAWTPAVLKERAMVPPGRWSCSQPGCGRAKHVELRTKLAANGVDVVEVFIYACGHTAQRTVGRVMTAADFRAIERRMFGPDQVFAPRQRPRPPEPVPAAPVLEAQSAPSGLRIRCWYCGQIFESQLVAAEIYQQRCSRCQ